MSNFLLDPRARELSRTQSAQHHVRHRHVFGTKTETLVVRAANADEAFDFARRELIDAGLVSASLQGSPRTATHGDLDKAANYLEPQEIEFADMRGITLDEYR